MKQFVMFYLKFATIALLTQQLYAHRQLKSQRQMQCHALEFVNQVDDQWFWNLMLTPWNDLTGIKVEIYFDDFVPAVVNNLGKSTSLDNRKFTIEYPSENLKLGQRLQFGFSAKSNSPFKTPKITRIIFNDRQICPEGEPDNVSSGNNKDGCAKFEMKGNGTGGRWDGVLIIFPKTPGNGIRVDIELDEKTWGLANDLGETVTKDQKIFTIIGLRPVHPSMPLVINLFAKFDEFESIPKFKSVSVNRGPICVTGAVGSENMISAMDEFSTVAPRLKGIMLSDLPFSDFPSVTLIPWQVNNNNFECGTSQNVLKNRFSAGSQAAPGQFPFHAAIFRDLQYLCGGSLISQKVVLTAAHCVVNDIGKVYAADRFRFIFGSVDLDALTGKENLREVEKIVRHSDYVNDKILKQDIALMTIKGNLQFSSNVIPICIFQSHTTITNHINERVTVLGFGANSESRLPSAELNYGTMSIISRQQCIESHLIFGLLPEQSAFCAKSVNDMIACPGDSGGGLIMNVNGKYFLRGISSVTITSSNGQCNPNASVAFTDVSFFLPWINENTREPEITNSRFFV